jgi:hypothetical protein
MGSRRDPITIRSSCHGKRLCCPGLRGEYFVGATAIGGVLVLKAAPTAGDDGAIIEHYGRAGGCNRLGVGEARERAGPGDVAVAELAVLIELLELSSGGFGSGIIVLAKDKGLAADAGNRIEQPGKMCGVGVEFAVEVFGRDMPKRLEHLRNGNLEYDLVDFGFALVLEQLETELLLGTNFFEPLLIMTPFVETAAGAPFGDVMFCETLAIGAEFFDNVVIAHAVLEHAIDRIADGFWQAGDLASSGM